MEGIDAFRRSSARPRVFPSDHGLPWPRAAARRGGAHHLRSVCRRGVRGHRLHDEDGNGGMGTDWMGRPREGWGASNDARGRFGPPSFEDACSRWRRAPGDRDHMLTWGRVMRTAVPSAAARRKARDDLTSRVADAASRRRVRAGREPARPWSPAAGSRASPPRRFLPSGGCAVTLVEREPCSAGAPPPGPTASPTGPHLRWSGDFTRSSASTTTCVLLRRIDPELVASSIAGGLPDPGPGGQAQSFARLPRRTPWNMHPHLADSRAGPPRPPPCERRTRRADARLRSASRPTAAGTR